MERKPNGQFVAIPLDQKTEKMLEVEKRLGRTLEEDFDEYYIKRGWGQKRLASRWGVKRQLIFGYEKSDRTSWIKRLNLTKRTTLARREDTQSPLMITPLDSITNKSCAVCHDPKLPTENAHWIPASSGGSRDSHNMIRLCPNHHKLLDLGDDETVEKVKEALLAKVIRKIVESGFNKSNNMKELIKKCETIIIRK